MITALASKQDVLIDEILQLTTKHQCSIQDGRFSALGSNYATYLLVSGNWSSIAKVEAALAALAGKHEIVTYYKRTDLPQFEDPYLPYLLQVVGLDTPQLIYEICSFFSAQDIRINDMQTNPFMGNYTNTSMMTIILSISVPAAMNISDLRERFILLCDELNVDGIMEPEKR